MSKEDKKKEIEKEVAKIGAKNKKIIAMPTDKQCLPLLKPGEFVVRKNKMIKPIYSNVLNIYDDLVEMSQWYVPLPDVLFVESFSMLDKLYRKLSKNKAFNQICNLEKVIDNEETFLEICVIEPDKKYIVKIK